MSELNERISSVVAMSGNTKTKFAEKINISQPYLSQLCSGAKLPSDRTIADICREFGVSETWLRTGVGEPYEVRDSRGGNGRSARLAYEGQPRKLPLKAYNRPAALRPRWQRMAGA